MKKRDLLLVFLITLIPRLLLALQAYPLVYISDETSAVSVAAMAAGYDWNDVVSHAGYYGIGYIFLFAPLFHIIESPIWIYRIILLISSVLVALSAPICYMVLYKFFLLENRKSRIIISTLCGALNLFTVINMTVRNEEVLYLIIWGIVYILCDMLYNSKSNISYRKKEIFLLILLGYALTIHTRAVCLIFGILFIDIIYRIIYKESIIHKWCYPVMAVIYFVVSNGLKLYQSIIWEEGAGNASVLSSVESSLSKIPNVLDLDLYLNILRIILGQTYTAGAVSGGLCIVAFFVLVFYLTDRNKKESGIQNYILVIGGMFLFCTIITICGMSVTWLAGVANGIAEYGEGVYRSPYRAFAYLRYMGCYVSPFVMCALAIVEKNKKKLKKAVSLATVVMCALTLFWINFILPYIYTSKFAYYITLGNMKVDEGVTLENWYLVCFLTLGITIVGFLLSHMKKEKIYFMLVILLLIWERIYGYSQSTLISGQKNYIKADAGYELIQKIQEEKRIESIYVYDGFSNIDNQIFYLYQFLNWSIKVIPELPGDEEGEVLLFSNRELDKVLSSPFYWAKLDNNEYVYCMGDEYLKLIEKCGIKMQELK